MSRFLLCFASICGVLVYWAGGSNAEETVLPHGAAPPAIAIGHFPDRVHEFVWRNWNAVDASKMAKILDTSVENVETIAKSMGLPPAAAIPPEMRVRGYITLIRRNWHLLPYDQLLDLLEMTPDQLAFTLREDDFLFPKLGNLKPKCERLRYRPPDEAAERRAAEIKRVVEETFGDELRRPGEPRFEFVKSFRNPSPSFSPPKPEDARNQSPHFIYSYLALYGDSLLDRNLDSFPEGLLQQLSARGVNGVWLHVVLRDLAPGGTSFPEFGAHHEQRLANLRILVERAKKYGLGVYLYINEPRAMPAAFFRGRPEMAGAPEGEFIAMCTSHPAVRQWMSDALAYVFRQAPGLAGAFTITASENLTNCASHNNKASCPRCKNRSNVDIIAEVNTVIEEGVHRGNPQAKVIVWTWLWPAPAPEIIARLPKSAWLMSVSEWGLPIERGGVRTTVGEYSISSVGPGPQAVDNWKAAQAAGLRTVAKVQVNNSWELSTVPYLPVMDLVAEHCRNLASAGVDGTMLSWSLGGYPSPNLEIAARFRAKPTPAIDEVLDAIAAERYGTEGAPLARKAWSAFSTAFRQYPFNVNVLYFSPVQIGPANPCYLNKTGYAATMVGIPYDDVTTWCGPYPADVVRAQFAKLAEGWQAGLADLRKAVQQAPAGRRHEALAELRFAEAASIHFQSVANQVRFVLLRDKLAAGRDKLSPDERLRLREEMKGRLRSEIALARRLFVLTRDDSRIGFEASNHYFYLPLDLVEKVINCRWLLDQLVL